MIEAKYRLSDNRQIKKVLQKGAARSGSFFRLKALKNNRLPSSSRISVVVSKKVSSKATDRNRIKRRTRAAFADEINKIAGYDLVCFPNRSVLKGSFESIREDAKECLKRLASY